LYAQEDRMSNVSLQDNQDYSRQLKVSCLPPSRLLSSTDLIQVANPDV
jgi:hypothetical protein